jgi:hypothetical protein
MNSYQASNYATRCYELRPNASPIASAASLPMPGSMWL